MKEKKLSISSISKQNINLLDQFISEYKDNEGHFRYFESRQSTIIRNHLATFLLMLDQEPIGYAHLDQEENRTWLGIAIKTQYQGNGMGKLLMQILISQARISQVAKVHLSVDNSNEAGINLYTKFGFQNEKIEADKRCMIWRNPAL